MTKTVIDEDSGGSDQEDKNKSGSNSNSSGSSHSGSDQEDHNNKSGSNNSSSGSSHSGNSSDSSNESDVEGNKDDVEEEEDDDGDRSRHQSEEEEDDVVEDDDENNRSSRSSRSKSRSDGSEEDSNSRSRSPRSRSNSGSSHSGSHLSDSDRGKRQRIKGDEKFWEDNPEIYGIRRSSRPRYETKPPKLEPQIGHKRTSSSNKKRPPSGKVKRRKVYSEEDDDDSSDEDNTRTIRKRNATVSYKEAESEQEEDFVTDDNDSSGGQENGEPEEHVETIERVMDSRVGKKGATGSTTTIYAVAEKGNPNDMLPKDVETEKQFFIKWTGWSHLHNTWESLETLQEMRVKGLKKLDNFCKKEDEHNRWKFHASPEDVEYVECQLELQQELVKCYVYAERIIAEQVNAEGVREFYVKWECLPYAEATWENADLIKKRNPEAIKIFKKREASKKTPSATSKCLKYRPKFTAVKSQPDFIKGEELDLILRDYQLDGLNWLVHSWCKENSVILADEMGLGKTIQTICFLAYLFETYDLYGPYLLVVPLSTMAAWQKEFSQWAPQINVVTYLGDIPSRGIIQEYEWFFQNTRKLKFNAILTTYEIVLKDKVWLSSVPWAALMVDEAHRLKNGESLLYKALVDFDSNHRLLITGTPLQNSLKELWSLLHFIMPHTFDDWEYFEKEHDHAATKGYAKLHKQLEPYILRRVKKDVEKSLPAKVEQILRVEMTTVQKQYYKWILTKNYTALRKGVKGSVTSFVNVVMELKKCCNHATLIKPLEQFAGDSLAQLIKGSGKLMLLDKLLVRLKDTGHRVLIFSQMVMMLDIIAEYLQLRRFAFQRLDGSIKGDMRKQALEHFNAENSNDFCFLLSTRAGGLGINLATADTVIIFDSDWNPQNDLQAQARAHRIGQKNQVMIYRLVTKNSVEEDIVERAKRKMVLDHLVIQRMDTTGRTVLDKGSKAGTPFNKDELNAILKFGAEELFKEDDNDGEDNCDIDEILQRAETHEESARPGDELLSAFKVASFSVNEEEEIAEPTSTIVDNQDRKDWDQIIPEDLRKRVEHEEKEKEMADLYLPPRSSRSAGATDVKGQPLGNEALNRKARNRKRKRGADKESEESESEDDGSGKPRKRGRPSKAQGKEIKGFTDGQIRKFLKSLKKFPAPLTRIDKVAQDCGLTERSTAELKKLAEQLLKGCQAAIAEQKANPLGIVKEEPQLPVADSEMASELAKKRANKPREKGPIFKVCGVGINARTMSLAVEELEALGEIIPQDETARKNWKLDANLKIKTPPFDVDWGMDDDTKILLGIWEYGMGSWDKIRESDPILTEKIFLDGDKKPLLKHISNRADYLLRVLKKHQVFLKSKQPKPRKKREPKIKPEKEADKTVTSSTDFTTGAAALPVTGGTELSVVKKEPKGKGKRGRKKKDNGPMHFAALAEPTPVSLLGDLDPLIFNECKEKMRPVKKALKSLDNPDKDLTEKEQIQQTRTCLIQIGKQIEACLNQYTIPEEVKQWKSYLWYFVSKFTEYNAKKLHRVYKKAVKRDKEPKGDKPKEKNKEKDRSEKKEKGEKKSKDKKHKKDKDKKSSRREKEETTNSRTSFHDNSNSSLGDSYIKEPQRDGTYRQYKEGKERGDRIRDPRDRDSNSRGERNRYDNDRVPPTNSDAVNFPPRDRDSNSRGERNRYDNDRVPPTNSDAVNFPPAPRSLFNPSPTKYGGVSNAPSNYSPHDSYPNQSYNRERVPGYPRSSSSGGDPRRDSRLSSGDPRLAPGDPRRIPHASKQHYNYNDRGMSSGSSSVGTTRPWSNHHQDGNRWGAPGNNKFGNSRREGSSSDSPYYSSGRPAIPPPPPTIGGLSPYQSSNSGLKK